MAGTKPDKPQGKNILSGGVCEAYTPGTLGKNDRADVDMISLPGDTEGPVGLNDFASMVTIRHNIIIAVEPIAEPDEVFVIDADALLKNAKTMAENAGGISDADLLRKLVLQEFSFKGLWRPKFYFKTYNGKKYVIFKGYAGLRKTLTAPKYLANNTKVLDMAVGKLGVIKNGLKSGYLTIVLVAAVDVVEYFLNDKATLADLGVNLFRDLTIATIASAAGIAAGLIVAGAMTGAVIAPIIAGIAVAYFVSEGLSWIDHKFELTETLKKWAKEEIDRASDSIDSAIRWYNWLNTPDGIMWFMDRLIGR